MRSISEKENSSKKLLYGHPSPNSWKNKIKQNLLGTARKVRTNPWAMFSNGFRIIDTQVVVVQQKLTYIGSVRTPDAVLRTCQEWWMIGTDRDSVQSAWLEATTPSCFDGRCNLCLTKKMQIMLYIDPGNLINQRWDFIARCRHGEKFRLFWKIIIIMMTCG